MNQNRARSSRNSTDGTIEKNPCRMHYKFERRVTSFDICPPILSPFRSSTRCPKEHSVRSLPLDKRHYKAIYAQTILHVLFTQAPRRRRCEGKARTLKRGHAPNSAADALFGEED